MKQSCVLIVSFCDDIRHEIGGKYSLIGCYGRELIVNKLPATLPKLCAFITLLIPSDSLLSRLTFRATINGDTIGEVEVPVSNMQESFQEAANVADLGRVGLHAVMVFSPLILNEPGRIQIVADTDAGLVSGSYIIVEEHAHNDASTVVNAANASGDEVHL